MNLSKDTRSILLGIPPSLKFCEIGAIFEVNSEHRKISLSVSMQTDKVIYFKTNTDKY